MPVVMLVVIAYFVGSIPTGVWLAKWKGLPDPRSSGSGNIGATNVARTLGKKMGIATLFGDLLKGLLPVLAGRALGFTPLASTTVAAAAVLGHTASIFLGFGGGKGVATATGGFLGAAPLATLAGLVVFVAIFAATRYVSLSSICAALVVPVAMATQPETRSAAGVALLISLWIVVKHRANVGRLIRGEEPKFGGGRAAAATASSQGPA